MSEKKFILTLVSLGIFVIIAVGLWYYIPQIKGKNVANEMIQEVIIYRNTNPAMLRQWERPDELVKRPGGCVRILINPYDYALWKEMDIDYIKSVSIVVFAKDSPKGRKSIGFASVKFDKDGKVIEIEG